MIMKNSLKNVCNQHNINFSSAKNVIQIFKKEGRLEKKIQRVRKDKSKNESKSDTGHSDLDLEEEKSDGFQMKGDHKSISNILLQMQDDDTFKLIHKKPLPDI